MAVQAGGRLQEDAGGALLLPAAAAQGHLLRRRAPGGWNGRWRRRRSSRRRRWPRRRRVKAVVLEQLEPAPAERALRRGHRRLRRVLQQVRQGRPQVKATLLNLIALSGWII